MNWNDYPSSYPASVHEKPPDTEKPPDPPVCCGMAMREVVQCEFTEKSCYDTARKKYKDCYKKVLKQAQDDAAKNCKKGDAKCEKTIQSKWQKVLDTQCVKPAKKAEKDCSGQAMKCCERASNIYKACRKKLPDDPGCRNQIECGVGKVKKVFI
jgi:hypothetical protein